jgi:hypothetical protein
MQHRPIVRPDTALNPLARCVLAVLGTACAGLALGGDGERARVQPAFDRAAIPPAHSSRIGSHNRTRAQLAIGTSRLPRGGATLAVTTCDDAGPGSLREAIGLAAAGDTIDLTTLTCGTITLETGVLATSASTLELDGPGETLLAIDGNGASQVLHHQGIGLYLTGLTIRNGMDASGYGGCLFTSGNLLMDASTITGCTAGDGSNAYAYGGGVDVIGNLTMVHSTISGNTATGTAGAIGGGAYVGGDLSAMSGSRISGNQATSQGGFVGGGGAYVSNTAMLDLATTVADNHATSTTRVAYGGGLQAGTSASVRYSMITGNTVHSGTSWAYGGGINLGYYGDDDFDRSLVFHHSTVSGNTATSNCESCSINGGGANAFGSIYSRGSTVRDNVVALDAASSGNAAGGGLATYAPGNVDTTISLVDSTVSGNSAVGGSTGGGIGFGGGLVSITGSAIVYNATIAFNSATTSGGGIAINAVHGAIASSSLFANNVAPMAADVAKVVFDPGDVTLLGDHDLVMQAGADVILPVDTLGIDPLLSPLADNGGATATHALLACSPAVDAGANPLDLDVDQRGIPFVRNAGAAPDIGAFELQAGADHIFDDGFDPSPCP